MQALPKKKILLNLDAALDAALLFEAKRLGRTKTGLIRDILKSYLEKKK